MKALGYISAFLGGAIDFCKKHDIKLSRKEMDDFVDDIKDSADEL